MDRKRQLELQQALAKQGTAGNPMVVEQASPQLPARNPYGDINVPDQGPLGAMAGAMYRQGEDTFDGVRKLYNTAIGDDQALVDLAQERIVKDAVQQQRASQHPIADFTGSVIPSLAMGGAAGANVGRNALLGLVESGLRYQDNVAQMGENAMTGAAMGAGGAKLGEVVGTALTPHATDPLGNIRAADKAGYPLTLADRTGSPFWRNAEKAMDSYPFIRSPYNKLSSRQPILNQRIMNLLGHNLETDAISPAQYKAAKDTISSKFNSALKGKTFTLKDDAVSKLDVLVQDAGKDIFRNKEIAGPVANLKEMLGPDLKLTGAKYQEIRKSISDRAQQEMTSNNGNRQLGMELKKLGRILDDAVDDVMDPDDLVALKSARAEWKAYKALDKGKAYNPATGNVRTDSLATNVDNAYPGYRTGGGTGAESELFDTLRAAKAFPIPGSSQTAERLGVTLGTIGAVADPVTTAIASTAVPLAYKTAEQLALNPQVAPRLGAAVGGSMGRQGAPLINQLLSPLPSNELPLPVLPANDIPDIDGQIKALEDELGLGI